MFAYQSALMISCLLVGGHVSVAAAGRLRSTGRLCKRVRPVWLSYSICAVGVEREIASSSAFISASIDSKRGVLI